MENPVEHENFQTADRVERERAEAPPTWWVSPYADAGSTLRELQRVTKEAKNREARRAAGAAPNAITILPDVVQELALVRRQRINAMGIAARQVIGPDAVITEGIDGGFYVLVDPKSSYLLFCAEEFVTDRDTPSETLNRLYRIKYGVGAKILSGTNTTNTGTAICARSDAGMVQEAILINSLLWHAGYILGPEAMIDVCPAANIYVFYKGSSWPLYSREEILNGVCKQEETTKRLQVMLRDTISLPTNPLTGTAVIPADKVAAIGGGDREKGKKVLEAWVAAMMAEKAVNRADAAMYAAAARAAPHLDATQALVDKIQAQYAPPTNTSSGLILDLLSGLREAVGKSGFKGVAELRQNPDGSIWLDLLHPGASQKDDHFLLSMQDLVDGSYKTSFMPRALLLLGDAANTAAPSPDPVNQCPPLFAAEMARLKKWAERNYHVIEPPAGVEGELIATASTNADYLVYAWKEAFGEAVGDRQWDTMAWVMAPVVERLKSSLWSVTAKVFFRREAGFDANFWGGDPNVATPPPGPALWLNHPALTSGSERLHALRTQRQLRRALTEKWYLPTDWEIAP